MRLSVKSKSSVALATILCSSVAGVAWAIGSSACSSVDATETAASSGSGAPCQSPHSNSSTPIDNPACSLSCEAADCSCSSKDGRPCAPSCIAGGTCWCTGCEGSWYEVSSASPAWWTVSPPEACAVELTHCPPELYDDCKLDQPPTFPNIEAPPQCGVRPGAMACNGSYWIQYCAADTDCPVGAACRDKDGETLGTCKQTCAPGSDECIRCGLACGEDGTCGGMPAKACRSDCECAGDEKCWPTGDPPSFPGGCGWIGNLTQKDSGDYCAVVPGHVTEATCLCTGGTCRADGCCELRGGVIANHEDDACTPR
jgi:hypothetical protein